MLQPAAHALLQSREEAEAYLEGFPAKLFWERPAGRASVAFHLQHITGVTNRLVTYAKGRQLDEEQLKFLDNEGIPDVDLSLSTLLEDLENSIDSAVMYLKSLQEEDLTRKVGIGRKRIGSTLIGTLFHAAEHSQRHVGQMLVTISVVKAKMGDW
ncbi:hypothetical protein GCM10023115_27590 [Pontixanthobacter gangjinensis]